MRFHIVVQDTYDIDIPPQYLTEWGPDYDPEDVTREAIVGKITQAFPDAHAALDARGPNAAFYLGLESECRTNRQILAFDVDEEPLKWPATSC